MRDYNAEIWAEVGTVMFFFVCMCFLFVTLLAVFSTQ